MSDSFALLPQIGSLMNFFIFVNLIVFDLNYFECLFVHLLAHYPFSKDVLREKNEIYSEDI